jgi:glutamyl-tRNA reductase
MAALAGATLRRAGVSDLVIINRSSTNGSRLADSVGGRFAELGALADEIAAADIVIAATGAAQTVIGVEHIGRRDGRPLALLDLALPRDVDAAVAARPDVHYVDLETLRADGSGATVASSADVTAAQAIIAAELLGYMTEQQRLAVAPTVTALRARANQVIDAELARLDARLPDIDAASRVEVATAVRRAVEKLLHAPTVRVKELASTPEGDSYAKALRELFDLDPAAVESVARPTGSSGGPGSAVGQP